MLIIVPGSRCCLSVSYHCHCHYHYLWFDLYFPHQQYLYHCLLHSPTYWMTHGPSKCHLSSCHQAFTGTTASASTCHTFSSSLKSYLLSPLPADYIFQSCPRFPPLLPLPFYASSACFRSTLSAFVKRFIVWYPYTCISCQTGTCSRSGQCVPHA